MPHDPMGDLIANIETSTTSPDRIVPNKHPYVTGLPYKLAIIGEAPGADEVNHSTPFVGMSGKFLNGLLSRANIVRDACFVGNVCQHRPPANEIARFNWEGDEIQGGLSCLREDLVKYDPNVCLLLGKTALFAAKGTDKIGDWRGSWFIGTTPTFFGRKCIASYHPAACLRQYEWTPVLMFDIKKAAAGALTKELKLPQRTLAVNLSYEETLHELQKVIDTKPLISVDIEGGVGTMSCLSIATSHDYSFIVPFSRRDGGNYYDHPDQETAIWRKVAIILGDPRIFKVLQNSLYDRFVLQYSYKIVMRGVVDDTMLKHWELYCEMEKSLGFQCSIYTDEVFYKSDRKTDDRDTFWRYCCKDSAVTYEINTKLAKWLDPAAKRHYDFNVALLNPILYMECRGIRYDSALAKTRLAEVNHHIHSLQYDLDCIADPTLLLLEPTKEQLLTQVREEICYKRDPNQPKAGHAEDWETAKRICAQATLSKADRGALNVICGQGMNVRSPKFKIFLFKTKGFPEQYDPKSGKLTTGFEALLKLKKLTKDTLFDTVIDIGLHRTRSQVLRICPDVDGRMKCSYNIVGSETGRLSSSRTFIYTKDGGKKKRVGTNMQTVSDDWEIEDEDLVLLTEGLRNLYVADPNCYIFQCDLKGADGWTVGAHMANLGDPTMLDDLKAGLKPAQIVCFILRYGYSKLAGASRDEIREMLKVVKKEDWDYYVCKQVIWGTCYLMGPRKAADQIFKESYGKRSLSETEARTFQEAVFVRYRVKLWQNWMSNHLARQPYPPKLVSASGQTRRFFGRSKEILGEALAHEPQAVTTYATNLAAYRLWHDPRNRIAETPSGQRSPRPTLRIEPLHQVHDALLGQFKIEDTTWAIDRIKSYFANEIVIANQRITIPFEGSYGTNWALDKASKVGSI